MTRTDQDEYLTKAGLKARGWTEKAIATFLGPCDRGAKNPVFRSAAPAKLYRTSRVEAAEQSAAYQAFVAALLTGERVPGPSPALLQELLDAWRCP